MFAYTPLRFDVWPIIWNVILPLFFLGVFVFLVRRFLERKADEFVRNRRKKQKKRGLPE
jgi:hypothetical protein